MPNKFNSRIALKETESTVEVSLQILLTEWNEVLLDEKRSGGK